MFNTIGNENTMTQSTYIDDLLKSENDDLGHSNVVEFYSGCNVLVTDATDFINKLIIEKLLRSCPKIGKLFILVKRQVGVKYKDRLESMFEEVLYRRLKREQPDFKSRVTLIEGDTAESKLGLSSTSRDFLQKNSHVVIHKAAAIRCDERLRRAVNINVRAVKLILQLAAEMPNLKAFVYISSAFSHYPNEYINERFYKPNKSVEKVLSLVKIVDDNLLESLTSNILGRWPNTRTFSQSLGEEVVRLYGSKLPTCIVRSAIALSTYKEPMSGCIDESHEITKFLASTSLGAIRVLQIDGECTAEVVPADYVVSNVLTAAWNVHRTWGTCKCTKMTGEREPVIYNCVSSCQNDIDWNTFVRLNQCLASKEPSRSTLWHHYLILVKHKWLYKVFTILLHLLPIAITDLFVRSKSQSHKLLRLYDRIHKESETFTYYGSKKWVFDNSNVSKLWNRMSVVDRKTFDFNIDNFEWKEYLKYYTRGLRVYLFKDPMSSLREARRKYQKMKMVYYAIATSLGFFLLYIIGLFITTYNFL